MPVHNNDVAEIFNKLADLLEIEGSNQFRIRAYRNAARTVSGLSRNVADMVKNGEDLSEMQGIGDDLAGKIAEIVNTGSLSQLKEVEKRVPAELSDLMNVASLGPKRVKTLYQELNIRNMDDLKKAVDAGQVENLEGFGQKTAEKIKHELERLEKEGGEKRFKLVIAEEYTRPLVEQLKKLKGVKKVEVAGSYRRQKETVGDIDILVTCKKGAPVMDSFVKYDDVEQVVSKGKTRSTVILRTGLQVDLRVVPQVSFGAAMHYFTGSKAHNIAIRKMGVKENLKINEYGVFKNDKRIAGRTEEEVYKQVDLPYIEPELREMRGEIEAAQKHKLPHLVQLKDIRGDLQSHTKASDGKLSLEEMADAARQKGYDYLAITDHSKHVTVANGLDEKRLAESIKQIDKLNGKLNGFRLLKSVEVDILSDGKLDLSDDILKELDIVICSVHYNFNLSRDEQTERVLRAMDNPYFNIFAHPTGRLIGEREPYEIDLEKVMKSAKKKNCFLEINAQPDRLDLSDNYIKMAKDMGVKLAISTDAHSKSDLDNMRFGVSQARRGWLEPDDVLNTRKWEDLKKLITRK